MSEPQTTERKEVFRGHLDECLEHLAKCLQAHAPSGLKGAKKVRHPIAQFCEADASTVKTWLDKPGTALGEKKIRLMCFLAQLGYHVFELEGLKNGVRAMAEIIGYKAMTGLELAILLGYKEATDVFRIVFGNAGMSTEKTDRLHQILKENKEKLAQKKQEARAVCRLSIPLTDVRHQKNVSAVVNVATGLLAMLESKEVGGPFADSLRNLPTAEKRIFARLGSKIDALLADLARQEVGQEDGNG